LTVCKKSFSFSSRSYPNEHAKTTALELVHPRSSNAIVLSPDDGSVMWVPPTRLTAHCHLTYADWPYDSHECMLKFGSWTHDGYHLDLRADGSDASSRFVSLVK
jgi:hypothetical protein